MNAASPGAPSLLEVRDLGVTLYNSVHPPEVSNRVKPEVPGGKLRNRLITTSLYHEAETRATIGAVSAPRANQGSAMIASLLFFGGPLC